MTVARNATAAHLRRGDTITAIAGEPVGRETVAAITLEDGTATITTRSGPQKRRNVRQLPATVPVTTDPPLPAWRYTDRRHEPSGAWKANAAAFGVGVVMGLARTASARSRSAAARR